MDLCTCMLWVYVTGSKYGSLFVLVFGKIVAQSRHKSRTKTFPLSVGLSMVLAASDAIHPEFATH